MLCSKCAECLEEDPAFDDGYCNPFWEGTKFDTSRCGVDADVGSLSSHPTQQEVSAMTCNEFDSAL